jgi:hypothetical protein
VPVLFWTARLSKLTNSCDCGAKETSASDRVHPSAMPSRNGRYFAFSGHRRSDFGHSNAHHLSRGAHSSGSPALSSASRKLGSVSTQAELCARKNAMESLGFNFIASANAAFALGILSAAA